MNDSGAFVAVGVDAGGSSTTAALSRGGAFVREAEGPAANATTLGVDDAADAILTTVRRVLEHEQPNAIVVGAAGAGRASVARSLEGLIASAFTHARVAVADDAAIALRSAIPSGPGIVLIAGTGSIAYAENGDLRARVGGLGYLLGDEGSAFAIGMAAVRLYARVLDGRAPRDETTDLVARSLDVPDRDALLVRIYDAPLAPAAIATLAPSIIAFAGKGNRVATKIVQQNASDLADAIKSAAKIAGLTDASPSVALRGGLVRVNSLLTYLVETRIVGDLPGASVIRGGDEPVRGALRLAEGLRPG